MAEREIPNVPTGQDTQMRNYLSAVREAVNKLSSIVGDGSGLGGAFGDLTGIPDNINALIDSATPPAPTGFAVQGMRVNSFLTWNASSFAQLSFTEIYRKPALMDATLMTLGTSYTIAQYGTINWSALGATSVAMASLVTGDKYVITAVGTSVNWAALGVIGDPVIGAVFTKLAITATGSGGAVLTATFTKNATAITGAGFAQFLPDFSGAVLVGTSNGHIYVDSIDPGAVYAYWIRFISYGNIAGPYANSGVGKLGETVAVGSSTAENIYGTNAWLQSADVLNGSITNAKIGNYIQSDNYNGSTLGWHLDKAGGNLNLNQLTVRDASGNVVMSSGGAAWQYVNGAGKPANNATVGATFGTNISGQITPSNISTYVANLAVDTLQIAGNAVVVPVAASFSTDVISTMPVVGLTPYLTLASITVNMSGGSDSSVIMFIVDANELVVSGSLDNAFIAYDYSLYDLTILSSSGARSGSLRPAANAIAMPSNSSQTYTLQVRYSLVDVGTHSGYASWDRTGYTDSGVQTLISTGTLTAIGTKSSV